MLEMFTDGLQLKFDKIANYDGKRQIKSISYLIILILGSSLLLLGCQFTQIKLADFEQHIKQTSLEIKNNILVASENDWSELAQLSANTGIEVGKDGLFVKNVGIIDYEMLSGVLGDATNEFSLGDVIKASHSDLSTIIFITLYLKAIPFILLAFTSLMILSHLLKKQTIHQQLTNRQALEMTITLITIPVLVHFCLKIVGLRMGMALFIFVSAFVLINFFYSRQLNLQRVNR